MAKACTLEAPLDHNKNKFYIVLLSSLYPSQLICIQEVDVNESSKDEPAGTDPIVIPTATEDPLSSPASSSLHLPQSDNHVGSSKGGAINFGR